MKEQLSQLVQDVIDGKESAIKASDILLDIENHVIDCKYKIYHLVAEEVELEANESHKDNDKPGTF
jgi:hypothetical protein